MIAHLMSRLAGVPVSAIVVESLMAVPAASQEKGKVDLTGIPQPVMEALNAKFPKAEIQQWTKEQEDGVVVYDIEMVQEGREFEADIKEDGGIHNWGTGGRGEKSSRGSCEGCRPGILEGHTQRDDGRHGGREWGGRVGGIRNRAGNR